MTYAKDQLRSFVVVAIVVVIDVAKVAVRNFTAVDIAVQVILKPVAVAICQS